MNRVLLATVLLLPSLLLSALSAQAQCRYTEVLSLPLTVERAGGHPSVAATIDGKPVQLLLDTGASRTIMLRAAMEKLGLSLEGTADRAYGAAGASVVYAVRPKLVEIGPVELKRTAFPVIDTLPGNGNAGLLGADFLLDKHDLEINMKDRNAKLFKNNGCADRGLSYWDPNAVVVPFADIEGGRPIVEVKLNGVTAFAMIDTGATVSAVTRDLAAQVGARRVAGARETTVRGIGIEQRTMWPAEFDAFTVGEETIKVPTLMVLDADRERNSTIQILLGQDFLRSHRVLIARSQQRVYLSYTGGPVFLDRP